MKYDYDVIIIGAGIGGLVCGCYLAKAGVKTLIIEKNANVGGCCSSFKSRDFTFDAFAHSLGGLRENGVFDIALRELDIKDRIKIDKRDPADIFVTPDYKICFWGDLNRTISELKNKFPDESLNIDKLMKHLSNTKGADAVGLMNTTFSAFLDNFIKDDKLKAILSMPVFGNTSLPASLASAFTAIKLYQEFHFDGGYYPQGGIQAFADLLANRFKELEGTISLSRAAKKILLNNNSVRGVEIEGEKQISSRIVVSNCDATQTFYDLVGDSSSKKLDINNMQPSLSTFSVCIGIEKGIDLPKEFCSTIWYMVHYDIEDMYLKSKQGDFNNISWFIIYAAPDKKGFMISMLAPFKNDKFWIKNKRDISNRLISCAKKYIPLLDNANIKIQAIITPQTIYRLTSNLNGASFGWASTPAQLANKWFTQNTFINGLYLTGHWTTQALGISGVAYMGRDTAKMIFGRYKK